MFKAAQSMTEYSLDKKVPFLGVGVAAATADARAITAATTPNQGLSCTSCRIVSMSLFTPNQAEHGLSPLFFAKNFYLTIP